MKSGLKNQLYILVIPTLLLVWCLIRQHIAGYYYLYQIDPEYPYLFNGLACAILEFDRIGHVDHPGTPFQILTGIFIRVTHLFIGKGNIVTEVCARPELYLGVASSMLSILFAYIVYWTGKIVIKIKPDTNDFLILQSAALLNPIVLDIQYRYIPDRFLLFIVIIISVLIYRVLYDQNFSQKKFFLCSGIVAAIGITTKIYFLPIALLPLFVLDSWKLRLRYTITLTSCIAIIIIPIYRKLEHFKDFAFEVISHDGLYGSGNSRFINPDTFFGNVGIVIKTNPLFFALIAILILTMAVMLSRKKWRTSIEKEFVLGAALTMVSLLFLLLIAKHYKIHYAVPMMGLSSIIFLLIINYLTIGLRKKTINIIVFGILLMGAAACIKPLKQSISYQKITVKRNEASNIAFGYLISSNDLVLVDPNWKASPFIENGLMYGISYAARHHLLYIDLERYYPNILSFEDFHTNMFSFRIIPEINEVLLKSGKSIFIFSAPGRRGEILAKYVKKEFEKYDLAYKADTVFSNQADMEYLIRFQNLSDWKTIYSEKCGFEKIVNNAFYTNNEKTILSPQPASLSNNAVNGSKSLKLDQEFNRSPAFNLKNIRKGDLIEVVIKIGGSASNPKSEYWFSFESSNSLQLDKSSFTVIDDYLSMEIKRKWKLYRYIVQIDSLPTENSLTIFFNYKGEDNIDVDDFKIIHLGERNMELSEMQNKIP